MDKMEQRGDHIKSNFVIVHWNKMEQGTLNQRHYKACGIRDLCKTTSAHAMFLPGDSTDLQSARNFTVLLALYRSSHHPSQKTQVLSKMKPPHKITLRITMKAKTKQLPRKTTIIPRHYDYKWRGIVYGIRYMEHNNNMFRLMFYIKKKQNRQQSGTFRQVHFKGKDIFFVLFFFSPFFYFRFLPRKKWLKSN